MGEMVCDETCLSCGAAPELGRTLRAIKAKARISNRFMAISFLLNGRLARWRVIHRGLRGQCPLHDRSGALYRHHLLPAGRPGLIIDVDPEALGRIAHTTERLRVPPPATVKFRDPPVCPEYLGARSIRGGKRRRGHHGAGRPDHTAGPFVILVGVVHARGKWKREPRSGLLDAEERQCRRARGVAVGGVAVTTTADTDRPARRIRREKLPGQTFGGRLQGAWQDKQQGKGGSQSLSNDPSPLSVRRARHGLVRLS